MVREPRDGLGRHTRRRGREEASSPTERDGSERFSDVDVGNGHGTALPPPLQRPQAGTTPWRGCTVIRETARSNRHFMHTGRRAFRAVQKHQHTASARSAPQPQCVVRTDIDVGVDFTTHPLQLGETETHTRERTASFLLFLVSFFFVFLGFL